MKLVNGISVALDEKQHCALLFFDLSKAFDTVDHHILRLRLLQSLSKQRFGLQITSVIGHNALDMMVSVLIFLLSSRGCHKAL